MNNTETLPLIAEDDFENFKAWLNEQPEGAIVGTSCDPNQCPVARWYQARQGVKIVCSILYYGKKGEHLSGYMPSWAIEVASATDQYTKFRNTDITKEQFLSEVLPLVESSLL